MYNLKLLLHTIGKKSNEIQYICKSKKLEGYKFNKVYSYDELPKSVIEICENFDVTTEYKYVHGVKYMCTSNNFKKDGVTNKQILVFDYIKDGYIHFIDSKFIVNEKKFYCNFDYAYAMTSYCVQGSTVMSFYFTPEDYEILNEMSNCNEHCYTIVSRIKTK